MKKTNNESYPETKHTNSLHFDLHVTLNANDKGQENIAQNGILKQKNAR